jgi:hypothetical protein
MKLQRVVLIGGLISFQAAISTTSKCCAHLCISSSKLPCLIWKYHHDYPATDIQAKKGCAFVAPISGVVDKIVAKDNWSGKTNCRTR